MNVCLKGKSMGNKYDGMVREKKRESKEKEDLALQIIGDLLRDGSEINIVRLAKETGLSRTFFYTNKRVRKLVGEARGASTGRQEMKRKTVLDSAARSEANQLRKQHVEDLKKIEALQRQINDLKITMEKMDQDYYASL